MVERQIDDWRKQKYSVTEHETPGRTIKQKKENKSSSSNNNNNKGNMLKYF